MTNARSAAGLARREPSPHTGLPRTHVLDESVRMVRGRGDVLDLRDAVVYHQLVLGAEGAKPATQKNYLHYEQALIAGMDALGIDTTLDSLTTANVRRTLDWYRTRIREGSSRGGKVAARQYVERIKLFANFLEKEEIIPNDTLRRLSPPRVEKLLRTPFTQAEVTAMWGACRLSRNPARDEAMLLMLLDTGMRIGEVATLTINKLDLEQRQAIVGERGKSRRERLVSLGDGTKRDGGRVIRALRTYLTVRPESTAREVFLSREGYVFSPAAAGLAIQRLGHDAGVAHPIPHRLRHTFCTQYLVMFPGDEIGLRRIVGHISKAVLADYIHISQSIIAQRAGRASLAEQWLGSGAVRL